MIETQRLKLQLIEENDREYIVKWRNQDFIINSLFTYKGLTINEHNIWYQNYLKDNSRLEYIINIKLTNKKIGTIGLSSIDYRNQKAEYGIIIGEQDEWAKGYAKEASYAILKYSFNELNLQKVYLKVFSDNYSAIKLYRNLGFNDEGLLRKEIYKNGSFKDVIIMSVLKEEWKNESD